MLIVLITHVKHSSQSTINLIAPKLPKNRRAKFFFAVAGNLFGVHVCCRKYENMHLDLEYTYSSTNLKNIPGKLAMFLISCSTRFSIPYI